MKLIPGETYEPGKIIARSHSSIDATGATLYGNGNIIISPCDTSCGETDYRLTDFSVKGGVWKNYDEEGYDKSGIKIAFAENVTLDGLDMEYCNYKGHAIEIMASFKLNGETCHNIYILNNEVTGCRAVCASFTKTAYTGNCHTNIVVENNILTGMSSEALALFNTSSATVRNNICISYARKAESDRSDSYYSGCHIRMQNKPETGDSYNNRKVIVSGNTCKGEKFGLRLGSAVADGYKEIQVTDNQVYSAGSGFESAYRYDTALKGAIKESDNIRYQQRAASFFGNSDVSRAKMITSIKIKGSGKVKAGRSAAMKAVVSPSAPSIKKLIWSVSNTKYASVTSNGNVKTRKAGKGKTITVTASSTDGSGKKAAKKLKIR